MSVPASQPGHRAIGRMSVFIRNRYGATVCAFALCLLLLSLGTVSKVAKAMVRRTHALRQANEKLMQLLS